MTEVPEEVILKYDGEEYQDGRGKKTLKLEEGMSPIVECVAVGGSTDDITMELYIGDRDLSEDSKECRGGRNEVCQEFQFDAMGSMDGKEMICVARLPSVDDSDSSRRQNLEYNGKQVAVDVEIECE